MIKIQSVVAGPGRCSSSQEDSTSRRWQVGRGRLLQVCLPQGCLHRVVGSGRVTQNCSFACSRYQGQGPDLRVGQDWPHRAGTGATSARRLGPGSTATAPPVPRPRQRSHCPAGTLRARCLCFLQGLVNLGYEVVSTGGSAAALEKAGVPVKRVEELTSFPEMLDGQ